MVIFLLFIGYILVFLGLAALLVPPLQPLIFEAVGLEPATSLYRFAMLTAALSLPLFLRTIALDSWRAAGYALPQREAWTAVGKGILIGTAIMIALTGTQWLLGMHHLDPDASRLNPSNLAKVLLSGAVSGLAVGFIEETFFRGLMHTGMRRTLGFWATAMLTATLYATLHFVKPTALGQTGFDSPAAVQMIVGGVARLGNVTPIADSFITLVVVGLFLSLVRERTGNILWAIGIHAGWVMIIKTAKYLTDPTIVDGKASPWIGSGYDDITGWMATLWLATLAIAYWYRARTKPRAD